MSKLIKFEQGYFSKTSQPTRLSLVSLMDIFTILVFFLLVNSSQVQVLQKHDAIELPSSHINAVAKDNLNITLTKNELLLQGKKLISIKDIVPEAEFIESLTKALNEHKQQLDLVSKNNDEALAINILADKNTPYNLLKRVMNTSADSGFADISLAVEKLYPADVSSPQYRAGDSRD
ncbi:ExbD/TolR family protein [Thalassotalea aquiviva]|uniref:ExbD/TolR family protein n=1 Tax=Thalassotalea aquiviva TaxID=3242415 RepID=UPI00352A34E5